MFGEKAVAVIFKELKQLNDGLFPDNPVIVIINIESLTEEDKRKSQEAVNLVKIKSCGKIKGRTCANGSHQRHFVKAEDNFASPTASLESILTTLIIDAYKGKDVAVADVPRSYLHVEFPKEKKVVLKLTGVFVYIMCSLNPEYSEHVIYEINRKGKKVKQLHARVLRALYGCIESAPLWYQLYSTTLQDMGFVLNPYDKCLVNKIINSKQCTIEFYVDNNKVSHEDPTLVTQVLD